MKNPVRSRRYFSYLFRCWEERNQTPDAAPAWRFSLEDVRTGRRRGFASLEALLVHVQSELQREIMQDC
jgi:hypothetical protein